MGAVLAHRSYWMEPGTRAEDGSVSCDTFDPLLLLLHVIFDAFVCLYPEHGSTFARVLKETCALAIGSWHHAILIAALDPRRCQRPNIFGRPRPEVLAEGVDQQG